MDAILTLILAHLLADFPFQQRWLAAYKLENFMGVLLHAATHLAIGLLLFLPFLGEGRVWTALLLVSGLHAAIDQTKIRLLKKSRLHPLFLFFADQLLHGLVLAGIGYSMLRPLTGFPLPYTVALYLVILILSTYFYDIALWVYASAKNPRPYVRNLRRMAMNGAIVTIAFVLYWIH